MSKEFSLGDEVVDHIVSHIPLLESECVLSKLSVHHLNL